MLIKFKTTASYPDITMFGEVALKLLKMMGRRGTVPSAISAEDIPAGRLIVRADGESEKTIGLNGSNLLIGRDRLCDICVQDVQVSRLHGLFVRAADGLHYVDLGSTNGSAVNGESTRRVVLGNKDVVAVGDVRIIYSETDVDASGAVDLDATDTFEVLQEQEESSINYVGKGVLNHHKP